MRTPTRAFIDRLGHDALKRTAPAALADANGAFVPTPHPRLPIWSTTGEFLGSGFGVLRRGGAQLALLYVLSQAVIALIALPVLGWLVQSALTAAGLAGIDAPQLGKVFASPLSLGLFALVLVLGYALVLAQFLLLLVAVRRVQTGTGLGVRAVAREFGALVRRMLRPSSLGLVPYLLLLLPLAGFGFFSVLTRTIAVPSFISGELTKTVPGSIGYVVFLLIVGALCTQFALTLPLFATSNISGARAGRLSWRLTKHSQTPLAFAVITVILAGLLSGFLILLVSITPTLLSDALWPDASPVFAAIGLGAAVTLGILCMGAAVVMVAAILMQCLTRSLASRPELDPGCDLAPVVAIKSTEARPTPRRVTLVAVGVLAVLAVGAGALTAPVIAEMSRQPGTLVLAHRGFDGVENTVAGLEGAHAANADVVEMDVMQTADGEFVVLHDANLSRLAGRGIHIADLTLDEATAITVTDLAGRTDLIPSLETYLARADDIGQQLLIEIKLHGRETDDFLERLVAQIEAQGVLGDHIYHSLDTASVEGLKRMCPALTVGYTMAVAGTALPRTSADFVVIEEWSYSSDLTAEAHRAGLGMFVWTVNDEMTIRQLLRDEVDGIITDRADVAVRARQQMTEDPGLATVLFDTIMRFVTIF
ncbi:MAG TPA: glycerophosphoryl diester phosphodiesterase membrane domain-containing protein [Microbacteriaceae bacterium]|nr:glycerophosphoryl diester phosphodiesterase membrane domain-containing protein [Microbacteriaceae bacterium]HRA08992.1 glycerophosphoryl diester phosphodiesterase membrane domain-containing protein [Microbacteriaceae bacterium]